MAVAHRIPPTTRPSPTGKAAYFAPGAAGGTFLKAGEKKTVTWQVKGTGKATIDPALRAGWLAGGHDGSSQAVHQIQV